jgi:hypothetical protein
MESGWEEFSIFDFRLGAAAPGWVSVLIFVSRGSAQSKIENRKSKIYRVAGEWLNGR